MNINIKIKNLNEIKLALAKAPVIVSKHINKAINKSILDIRNAALDTTPVDTGRLRGSYEMKYSQLRGEISPTAEYAYWVEVLPYRHSVGQSHYLQAAVENSIHKINNNFKEGLKDSLAEIARNV